jgi:hypothetical protein
VRSGAAGGAAAAEVGARGGGSEGRGRRPEG